MKTYYGNKPIKDLEEINSIFELYEKSGIIHYQDMLKLKTYLTPPTAEEVCEALSEYLEKNTRYNNVVVTFEEEIFDKAKWHSFKFMSSEHEYCNQKSSEIVTWSNGWRGISFGDYVLPPQLITLIGRFYEALK